MDRQIDGSNFTLGQKIAHSDTNGALKTLAHAHLGENLFSGDYWLVGKNDQTVQT